MKRNDGPQNSENAQFQSTRWSLVLAAKNEEAQGARDALADLCRIYWYPLFAYIRRKGHDPVRAQDLTQGFFLSLLEHDFLQNIDQTRGRFRHYLLAACKNYLAVQHRNAQTQKRGGHLERLSLDFESAERRFQLEPAHATTADQLFDYRWAVTLVNRVVGQLHEKNQSDGKGEWFNHLRGYLDGQKTESYKETADQLGTTEGAVRVAVHRLRQHFGQLFRQEIEQTVSSPDEVDEEIRAVFRALAINS